MFSSIGRVCGLAMTVLAASGCLISPASGAALAVTTTRLPATKSGEPYRMVLSASGALGTTHWTLSPGSRLPAGFALSRDGVLSSSGNPKPPPYAYELGVSATDSAGHSAQQNLRLLVAPSESFCPAAGTTLTATLPAVAEHSDPSQQNAPSWTLSYPEITLAATTDEDASVACEAQTIETLPVYFNGSNLAKSTGPVQFAVLDPGALTALPSCNFVNSGGNFGTYNECLLNGTFDPNALYLRWSTTGFSSFAITPAGSVETGTPSRPFTFWVNLNTLGSGESIDSMAAALQLAAPYIHVTLTNDLPELPGAAYTIVQAVGGPMRLTLVNAAGLTSGTLPDGVRTFDIPLTFTEQTGDTSIVLIGNYGFGRYLAFATAEADVSYYLTFSTIAQGKGHAYLNANGYLSQGQDTAWELLVEIFKGPKIGSGEYGSQVLPGDLTGDFILDCRDLDVVKRSFNKKTGQPGFNAWADINDDGIVNIVDLAYVAEQLAPGTVCPPN